MSIILGNTSPGKGRPAAGRPARAILRRDRSPKAERLTVCYAGAVVRLELVCAGRVLASGPWQCEVLRDQPSAGARRPARVVAPWQPTCRTSDENVDYLELTMQLSGGLRIERHLVLARKDRFLLLADAVLGTRPGALGYRGLVPLGPGIALRGAGPTRERFLVAASASRPLGKRLATVLPLALPEWRRDHRVGELSSGPEGMELCQAIQGRRLFAPLWLDLDPGRVRQRRTWRQLTVAESLTAQAADVAVGYRVALGSGQWLVYRSLARKRNRSLLGHNLATETLVARFGRHGEVQSIIEIE
jgi:hypothetical protein